jgi:NADPH-dependent curcumin reductase CurA
MGTCSSDSKVEFLKSLGCDRPINYKKEDFKDVLKEEYPVCTEQELIDCCAQLGYCL